MVIESNQEKTLDPGFIFVDAHQKSVTVIVRELLLLRVFDTFHSVSQSEMLPHRL